MFWSLEEWQGKKGGKKDKKEKITGTCTCTCVEEKRKKEMPCVEDKKEGEKKGKKRKEMVSQYFHNKF